MRITKELLSELKQYKGLDLNASDLVKIAKELVKNTKEFQG